jgi:hypothetical protein
VAEWQRRSCNVVRSRPPISTTRASPPRNLPVARSPPDGPDRFHSDERKTSGGAKGARTWSRLQAILSRNANTETSAAQARMMRDSLWTLIIQGEVPARIVNHPSFPINRRHGALRLQAWSALWLRLGPYTRVGEACISGMCVLSTTIICRSAIQVPTVGITVGLPASAPKLLTTRRWIPGGLALRSSYSVLIGSYVAGLGLRQPSRLDRR